MKNVLMRLFKQSILMIGVFAVALPAIAATFNNDPLDLATVRVMNVTRSGIVNTAWAPSVTANPNDIISFAIYYHNTAPDAAGNTRVSLLVPTTAGTSIVVPGSVRADNAATVNGSATVNISNTQSLVFIPGSVVWRPDNCTSCNRQLPFGQNGNELFTAAGLNLGSIGPDSYPRSFSSQGSVVVDFIVTSNQQTVTPPPAQNITPNIQTNAVSNLTCTDVTLNGFVNTNGNASFDVFFEIANNPSMTGASQTSSQTFTNSSGNFSRSVSVAQNTTQYYRAVARVTNGTATTNAQQIQSFVVPACNQSFTSNPVLTTNPATNVGNTDATLNGFLNANGNQVVTTYFDYGVGSSCVFTNRSSSLTFGNISTAFSQTVTGLSPNTTYCYRAVGQLTNGTQHFGGNQLFTTGTQQVATAFVQTNPASSVASDSAVLNGFVSMSNNFPQNTSVFFEYGPTVFLGNTTAMTNLGSISSSNFARFIAGLSPSTTYYFRAAAQLSNGTTVRGNILTFTTTSGFQTFTPAPQGPTGFANVTLTKEAANLTFPNGTHECLAGRIGDVIEYRITVRNTARFTQATNLTVRDAVPANTSFVTVSNGGTVSGNEISWNVGTLTPGETRTLSFQVRVNPVPTNTVATNTARVTNGVSSRNSNSVDLIILTSTAPGPQIITGPTGQQFIIGPDGQPQPYNGQGQVTVNTVDNENTAEEVADAVSTFFPKTALGWLGLLILVAVIALIIRAIV